MCRSMVDSQSATAEIRRGIKKDRKKPQGKNIMSASATQGGHNQTISPEDDQFQQFLLRSLPKIRVTMFNVHVKTVVMPHHHFVPLSRLAIDEVI